jgi:thioredoxin reductase
MSDVAVIGGGPAGLSAALFTAKNGLETVVFDTGDTWMQKAHLFNYLGIRSVGGDEFMAVARGQTRDRGAEIRDEEAVEAVERTGDGFAVHTDEGEYDARYVVFATGAKRDLAAELGCETTEEGPIDVNLDMQTSVDGAYATGAMVRAEKWQAAISAGDGAAAALDILSTEKGEHFHDFDTPGDVPDL